MPTISDVTPLLQTLGQIPRGSEIATPEEVPSANHEHDRLALATTWFRCPSCSYGDAIDFPRVLWHECFTTRTELDIDSGTLETSVSNALVLHGELGPWSASDNPVEWYARSAAAAEEIIRACGMDPVTTTAAKMDELDMRLTCVDCTEPIPSQLGMVRERGLRHPIMRTDIRVSSKARYIVAPAYTWRKAVCGYGCPARNAADEFTRYTIATTTCTRTGSG